YATEQMAKHPDYTMERIAELSGFAHKSHFCKIFREITGGSFTEYKNR
ncbi:AraC family transcriptional regulator, partial [Escherichia coli]|nr:AraC family transcriptional regulator [Escherichia coli]